MSRSSGPTENGLHVFLYAYTFISVFFVWTFVFVLSFFFERENLMGSEVSRIWEEIGERKGYDQNILYVKFFNKKCK